MGEIPAPLRSQQREALRAVLESAVRLELPYPYRSILSGRPAAVLILIGLRESDGTPEILFTRRTEHLETHKGQYAFPGGMRDPEDESIVATALREAEEEMGISPTEVEVFGALPEIWTPSGFSVTPVIGFLKPGIEEIRLEPNPAEIDFWFWCKLDRFREEGVYSTEMREVMHEGDLRVVKVDVYQMDTHRIWGATGAMLRNFIDRFDRSRGSR